MTAGAAVLCSAALKLRLLPRAAGAGPGRRARGPASPGSLRNAGRRQRPGRESDPQSPQRRQRDECPPVVPAVCNLYHAERGGELCPKVDAAEARGGNSQSRSQRNSGGAHNSQSLNLEIQGEAANFSTQDSSVCEFSHELAVPPVRITGIWQIRMQTLEYLVTGTVVMKQVSIILHTLSSTFETTPNMCN